MTAAGNLQEKVAEELRRRIESSHSSGQITVRDEALCASVALPRFYEERSYSPAWSGTRGILPQADELSLAIKNAAGEGLLPNDYHLDTIENVLRSLREEKRKSVPAQPSVLADIDLLLTDAYLLYASHLLMGKVDPERIDPEWRANRRGADFADLLHKALESGRIEDSLAELVPAQRGYKKLREALKQYKKISREGGWLTVPSGPKMQRGDRGDRVVLLRSRLLTTGDLQGGEDSTDDYFDDVLEQAVLKFQKRHGLEVDGVVGAATIKALNVPVEKRVHEIVLNMERWRWLPQELGRHHIIVNIAKFELDVVEDGETILDMRVVVGRQFRHTPVFSDMITYLVLCPSWSVPPTLARQDILPEIRKDPEYLQRKNIKVFLGWGSEAKEVDPGSVDWSAVRDDDLPYKFRQEAGLNNALGRVKFMFPNKYNVYLHDTPAQDLFMKSVRTFSSGCIRIEKPIELAEYLLKGDERWTLSRIRSEIQKWKEQTVRLPEPIPIHILYWTAWVDDDGTVHFREDVYERDDILYGALQEVQPQ